jgi:hypothetical protein
MLDYSLNLHNIQFAIKKAVVSSVFSRVVDKGILPKARAAPPQLFIGPLLSDLLRLQWS